MALAAFGEWPSLADGHPTRPHERGYEFQNPAVQFRPKFRYWYANLEPWD